MSDINIHNLNFFLPEDKIEMNRLRYHPINFKYISCSLCHFLLPFDKSEACSLCGTQYCSSCITLYLKFNERKCANKTCDKIYYPMILLSSKKEELEELEIRCRYEKCGTFKKFKELYLHETQCRFREILCPACCGKFNETDYSNHIQNCTENFLTCQSCGFKAKVKDLINHSCEIFLYIKNQIKSEYEKEKENLRREIREEILNELKPQMLSYIKNVMDSEKKNETVTDNLSIKSDSPDRINEGLKFNGHKNNLNEKKIKKQVNNISTTSEEICLKNKKKKNLLKLSKDNNGFLKNKKKREEEKSEDKIIKNDESETEDKAHHPHNLEKQDHHLNKFKKEENDETPSNMRRSHRKSLSNPAESKFELIKDLIKFNIEDKITCMTVLKLDQVLYGTDQGDIIRYNTEKNKSLRKYSEHKKEVVCITIIDENKFISSSKDLFIKIWNVKESISIKTIDPEGVYPLSIVILNEKFITGDSDGLIRLWKLDGEFLINTKDKEINDEVQQGITCLTLLDNNRILSGEVDGSICLWNIETMALEIRFESHIKEVTSIVKCNDEKFFSCSEDGQVRLYSVENPSEYVLLYKFLKRVCDIVYIDTKYLYCINKKELNIIEIEKKDVIKRKYLTDKVSNLLMLKQENKVLIYNMEFNYYYIFSYSINEN
jgi:WD40 repeat protein